MKGFRSSPPPASLAPKTSSTTAAPWAPASPFLEQAYGQSAKLFSQGPAKYTPWGQVAGLAPDQLASIRGTQQYVNSAGTHELMNTASGSMSQLMNGGDNPYRAMTEATNPALAGYLANNSLADVSGGLNQFMFQDTSDPALQGAIAGSQNQAGAAFNDAAGLVQNRFGIGQTIAGNLDRSNLNSTVNNSFGQGFDLQNSNRVNAIKTADSFNNGRVALASNLAGQEGQYTNNAQALGFGHYKDVMNAPLGLLQQLENAGGVLQGQDQLQISDASARWDHNQNKNMDLLAKYAAAINPNPQWGNQYTANNTYSRQAGTNPGMQAAGAASQLASLGISAYNQGNKK